MTPTHTGICALTVMCQSSRRSCSPPLRTPTTTTRAQALSPRDGSRRPRLATTNSTFHATMRADSGSTARINSTSLHPSSRLANRLVSATGPQAGEITSWCLKRAQATSISLTGFLWRRASSTPLRASCCSIPARITTLSQWSSSRLTQLVTITQIKRCRFSQSIQRTQRKSTGSQSQALMVALIKSHLSTRCIIQMTGARSRCGQQMRSAIMPLQVPSALGLLDTTGESGAAISLWKRRTMTQMILRHQTPT